MFLKKYDYIDFLRGIAILLVIINHIPHTDYILNESTPFIIKKILLAGTYGVQLFYIVSAFTLCNSMENRNENNYKNFYIRRIFRVVPLFYLGIIIYYLYYYFRSSHLFDFQNFYTLKNLILNLFFINNFIPPSISFIPGGETITTELNFYLIFPFLFYYLIKKKKIFISIIFIIPIMLILNLIFHKFFNFYDFGQIGFYRTIYVQLFVFLLGFLFYYLVKQKNFKKAILVNKKYFIFIILAFIFVILNNKINPEYFYFKNLIIISFILLFFSYLIFLKKKILKNYYLYKLICNFGKVSYSMYIFHWIVLDIITYVMNFNIIFKNSFLNLLTVILSGILITYFIALISYRFEKFFINFGKKFS
jgi:peptidoglycan/LPS O-acetylase OafA/YrhL